MLPPSRWLPEVLPVASSPLLPCESPICPIGHSANSPNHWLATQLIFAALACREMPPKMLDDGPYASDDTAFIFQPAEGHLHLSTDSIPLLLRYPRMDSTVGNN